jgi:predicted peptidase
MVVRFPFSSVLGIAIALLVSTGCLQPASGIAFATVQELTPGSYNRRLLRGKEPPIHYALSIPPNYSPSIPVPLILALHFGVGSGDAAGAGRSVLEILVRPALAELGAIIVAPDSLRGDWSTPENEGAVNELLDSVLGSYNVDRKKIVVTGFSMGGAGAWHLAEKYPDRFSAVIPVSGRPPAFGTEWHLPVLAIHSRNDQVVPFGPTEARIAETYRFVEGLHRAVPWLREIWKQEDR